MTERRYSTAFGLSLAAGVLILIGSLITWILFPGFQWNLIGHMMGGEGMMGGTGMGWLFPLPLVSGAVVLVGTIGMNLRPQQIQMWGTLVLIFSILALIGMGFSILGGLLGIASGIIALSQRLGNR
jgi:hypothetical protein